MDLSIIIVNWNSAAFLNRCLATIYGATRQVQFEVIVIDNASFDGANKVVAKTFPAVKFIQSSANLGFSGANNLAVEHSTGRNLLFLNPDTEILGTALETMITNLDSCSTVGVLGCKLLNSDGSVQTSCVQAFPTVWNQLCDVEFLRSIFPHANIWGTGALMRDSATPERVEVVSGACLMIKRSIFEQVGGFSTAYFMYAEDADLCYKVKHAGWSVAYLSIAQVVHHGGGSSSRSLSRFSAVMMKQSLCEFIRLRRGTLHALIFRICMAIAACIRLFVLGGGLALGRFHHESIHNSVEKWFTVLRWAIGLEGWAIVQSKMPSHSIVLIETANNRDY